MKKEIGKEVLFDTLINGVVSAGTKVGELVVSGLTNDTTLSVLGGVGVEMVTGMIPGIGSALTTYRLEKEISNIKKLFEGLAKRSDELSERVNHISKRDKEVYMDLIDYAVESAGKYTQEEKIKYLADGLVTLIKTDNVSYDTGYLYINTLNRLSLLDISVIRVYSTTGYFDGEMNKTYQDVLDEFNIEYYQYEATQRNLEIMGILETKTDQNIEKDLEMLVEQIKRIDKNLKSLQDDLSKLNNGKPPKRLTKLKNANQRLKSKDRYVLSKFGRDFYNHFIS